MAITILQDGSKITVTSLGWREGRYGTPRVFRYRVTDRHGNKIMGGADLAGGHLMRISSRQMTSTLITFLLCDLEADRYGSDEPSSFTDVQRAWADDHEDELSMIVNDIDGIEP